MIDFDIFDAGIKSISDFGDDDLMPYFIYCGDYYFLFGGTNREVQKGNYFDKNEKIWNSIINTYNAVDGWMESGDKRNSQKSS